MYAAVGRSGPEACETTFRKNELSARFQKRRRPSPNAYMGFSRDELIAGFENPRGEQSQAFASWHRLVFRAMAGRSPNHYSKKPGKILSASILVRALQPRARSACRLVF